MPSPDDAADLTANDDSTQVSDSPSVSDSKRPVNRLRRLQIVLAAVTLGGITGLVGVLFFYARQSGPPLPTLTVERFDTARANWRASRIPNYDIQIEVLGMQPAVYEVEVRSGVARKALRNGRPLTQRRTWGTWSVDGMFSTIAADVAHLRDKAAGRNAEAGAMQLTLGAEFHPELHYPTRYYRLEQVQFGNNRSATWQVKSFRIVDSPSAGAATEDDAS